MLNPRCETNKFSRFFFRFCRCGHNAKENGSPWCPISRKNCYSWKTFSFLFSGLNNISILQHYTRGMCTNTLAILEGYFCFLFQRPFLSPLHIWAHERIIFLGASHSPQRVFLRLRGLFWWGLKRDEGERSLQSERTFFALIKTSGGEITHRQKGWDRVTMSDEIWFSIFAQKIMQNWWRRRRSKSTDSVEIIDKRNDFRVGKRLRFSCTSVCFC